MKDTIRWLPVDEQPVDRLVTGTPEALAKTIAKTIAKETAWWTKGLPKADALGKTAVELTKKWSPKTKYDVTKTALVASLLGAYEPDNVFAFVEYIVQTKGGAFALEMCGIAWTFATSYHNPSWPNGTKNNAVWLHACENDTDDDSSVSYGKARITTYLADAGERDPKFRAAMQKALPGLLKGARPQQLAPLIYAAHDVKRANDLLAKIVADKHHSRFGEGALLGVADDVKLVLKGSGGEVSYDMMKRFGTKVLDALVKSIATAKDKYSRERKLDLLANFHGPKAARVFAGLVTMASQKPKVVAYFERYPELLDFVLADPKCAEDHEYLTPLRK